VSLLLAPAEETKTEGRLLGVLQGKVAEYNSKVGGGVSPGSDIRFDYVRCAVHALVNLRCQLKLAVEEDETKVGQTGAPPGPPPDTLSMSQSKAVSSLLQMVVTLGLLPNLLPGVAPPLDQRSDNLLASNAAEEKSILERYKQLVFTLESLLELRTCRALSTIVMTRNLGNILSALVQVANAPLMKPKENSPKVAVEEASVNESETTEKGIEVREETFVMTEDLYNRLSNDQARFKNELDKIVSKTYQPLVVKNLLILQSNSSNSSEANKKKPKPPKWFVKTVGSLLSERLLAGDDGVMHVVRGVLDLAGEMEHFDWQKIGLVAGVIGNPPQGKYADIENYYAKVCPQLMAMLASQETTVNMIACSSIKTVAERSLILSRRHLLDPLMAPLTNLAGEEGGDEQALAVTEQELDDSVKNLFKIFVIGNDPSLMFVTHLESVLLILLNMYLSITFGVSHLRDPVKQLIERYLKHSDRSTSLAMIRAFALDEMPTDLRQNRAKMLHADVAFANGEEGGVKVIKKVESEQSFYVSDDERAIVVQDLLEEVKDKQLSVEFFLSLMEDLTNAMVEDGLGEDVELPEAAPGVDLEQQLKDLERHLDQSMHRMRRNLMVIRLLGLLSEDESFQENLLKHSDKMIQFVSTSIKRAASEVRAGTTTSTMGVQSLNMSLSILSVHLTQQNVPTSDWEKMLKVSDDLEVLGDHEDTRISKISGQLHKLVLTHGTIIEEIKALKENTAKIVSQTGKMKEHTNEFIKEKKNEENKQLDEKKAQLKEKANELKKQKELRKNKSKEAAMSKYEAALYDVSDPLLPVQGHGLISLARLVEEKDQETLDNLDKVRLLFQSNLEDSDTYIYLNAIKGLVVCASYCPNPVLEVLVKEFGLVSDRKIENKEGEQEMQLRTKVGEALVQITRDLGELTPHYKNLLLNSFFSVANDPDPLVRASGLSNLGEVVKNLRFSLGSVTGETLGYLAACSRDQDPGVRAAAVMVLTMVLQGLGRDAFTVLDSCLRDIYRELKLLCSSEKDETVRVHLGMALDEVDNIVKSFLTPDTRLEKKIYILDTPPDCF